VSENDEKTRVTQVVQAPPPEQGTGNDCVVVIYAAEQGLLNYDGIRVYEKWINDLGDEQRPTGELPGIVPSSGWGYEWGNGPAWDSAFLLIPWYLYEYYGDPSSLKAQRYNRVHLRRTPRRNPAGQQCNKGQQQRSRSKRCQIGRTHAKE